MSLNIGQELDLIDETSRAMRASCHWDWQQDPHVYVVCRFDGYDNKEALRCTAFFPLVSRPLLSTAPRISISGNTTMMDVFGYGNGKLKNLSGLAFVLSGVSHARIAVL